MHSYKTAHELLRMRTAVTNMICKTCLIIWQFLVMDNCFCETTVCFIVRTVFFYGTLRIVAHNLNTHVCFYHVNTCLCMVTSRWVQTLSKL